MIKNLLVFVALTILLAACAGKETAENKKGCCSDSTKCAELKIDDFSSQAEKFIDKKICIKGNVSHICKHGGKRLFLTDDKEQTRIEVTVTENMPSFDVALEGNAINVEGIVREMRIDEKYLSDWENEAKQKSNQHGEKEIHTGEAGHEMASLNDELAKINSFREKVKASEKGYLSVFSIECLKHNEVK